MSHPAPARAPCALGQWCSLSSSVAARTGRFDSADTGFPTRNMATEEGVGLPVHADCGRTVDAAHPSRTVAPHHGQPHHVQQLARVQRGCSQFQPPHRGYRCWRCSLKCQVRRRDRRPSRMRRCSLTSPLPTQCTLLAKSFYECIWSLCPPPFNRRDSLSLITTADHLTYRRHLPRRLSCCCAGGSKLSELISGEPGIGKSLLGAGLRSPIYTLMSARPSRVPAKSR